MSILAPNHSRPRTAAELFAPLSVRLGLTTLEIHASTKWGSSQPDHRKLLHDAMKTRITELGCVITTMSPYPVSAPADLSTASAEIPRSISISVSHSKTIGGFALLSTREGTIGFDIEDIGRVSDAVAKRVRAQTAKRAEAPPDTLTSDLFWTAKEASFKALRGPQQPAVLSDIGLGSWEVAVEKNPSAATISPTLEASAHFYEIDIPKQIQGLGLTLSEKTHALSIFVLKPST